MIDIHGTERELEQIGCGLAIHPDSSDYVVAGTPTHAGHVIVEVALAPAPLARTPRRIKELRLRGGSWSAGPANPGRVLDEFWTSSGRVLDEFWTSE